MAPSSSIPRYPSKRGSSSAICDTAGQAPWSQVSRWQVEQSCPSPGEPLRGTAVCQVVAARSEQAWGPEGCGTGIAAKPCCLGMCSFGLLRVQIVIYTCIGINQKAESGASWYLSSGALCRMKVCVPGAVQPQGFGDGQGGGCQPGSARFACSTQVPANQMMRDGTSLGDVWLVSSPK